MKVTSDYGAEIAKLKACVANMQRNSATIINVATYEEMMAYNLGAQKILFIVANDSQYSLESTVYLWDGNTLASFMAQKNEDQPTGA